MKLRPALLTVDLGFRFHVSATTASSIFITWAKLMSKELSLLIVWPSWQQVKKTLPSCFRKLYPKLKSGALLIALSALRRLQVVLIWQQTYGVSIRQSMTTRLRFLSQSHRMELFRMSLHVMKGGHLIFLLWRTVAFWRWLNFWWNHGRRDLTSERTWWCRWQHYASHPVVHHRCSCFHGMLGKHSTLLMYRSMWSKPLADWKFSFFWKMNCPLPCLPWLMILFVSAVLCVICSHHSVFNIFVCKYVILFTKCSIWTGAWKKALSDVWLSSRFSFQIALYLLMKQQENLTLHQVSIRASFPAPLHMGWVN